MVFEGADISKIQSKQSADSSERLMAEVDVINHLTLVNPARIQMQDIYGRPTIYRGSEEAKMLDDFAIADPKDFMKGVHGLSDRAKEKAVPLNKDFLKEIRYDARLSKEERSVAIVMGESFKEYGDKTGDERELKWWWGYERRLVLSDERIAKMDRTADAIDNAKKHPEMRDASNLAEAAQSILTKSGGQKLSQEQLRDVAFSTKHTPEERAAAMTLMSNFTTFDQLGAKNKGIDQDDINELKKLAVENPEQAGSKTESCLKESVSGKAAAWGVAVGVLSLATGSKHAMRNAVVAASSAAATTGIKNSLECKRDR
ncbi:MAG: hypothetical protein IT342_07445 [Candidatus Melainabacteria bacterium]|nr:hypothetical protein [Candidatus Melainabacteria bacterium]